MRFIKKKVGTTIELKPADFVHIEADAKHSVDAIEESNFIDQMSIKVKIFFQILRQLSCLFL
jgi:quercetin dioxygenase-like cupin family protein